MAESTDTTNLPGVEDAFTLLPKVPRPLCLEFRLRFSVLFEAKELLVSRIIYLQQRPVRNDENRLRFLMHLPFACPDRWVSCRLDFADEPNLDPRSCGTSS